MKNRKLFLILVVMILSLWSSVALADEPIIFQSTFTVTEKGGEFTVGFATLDFKKEALPDGVTEITFNAQIYAENGTVYLEVKPDVPDFDKKVTIKVSEYKGYIYDKAKGENIYVEIKKQTLKADHFSRYAFMR